MRAASGILGMMCFSLLLPLAAVHALTPTPTRDPATPTATPQEGESILTPDAFALISLDVLVDDPRYRITEQDIVRCDACIREQALKLQIEDKSLGQTAAVLVEDIAPEGVSIVGTHAVLVGGSSEGSTVVRIALQPPYTVERLADGELAALSPDGTRVVYSSPGVKERGLAEVYETANVVNVLDLSVEPPHSYVVHPPFAARHQNPSAYAPLTVPIQTIENMLSPYSWRSDGRKIVFFEGQTEVDGTKQRSRLTEIDLMQGLSAPRTYATPLDPSTLGNPKSKTPGAVDMFRVDAIVWLDNSHVLARLAPPLPGVTDAWLSDTLRLPLPSTQGAQPEGTPTLLPVFATPVPTETP